MIPDEEGKLHVIDVNPIEDVVEPAFNPETDTRFVLFTRNNPTSGQQLLTTIESIRDSNFDKSAPVRVLIHGWNSGKWNFENACGSRHARIFPAAGLTSGVNTRPTESYLQLGNFNVIQVGRTKRLDNGPEIKIFLKCRSTGLLVQAPLIISAREIECHMWPQCWRTF
jgi:hypothetical protein